MSAATDRSASAEFATAGQPDSWIYMEVCRIVAEYALALDGGDFERFRAIWAADARFATNPDFGMLPVPMIGRDAITSAFEQLWHRNRGRGIRHFVGDVKIHGTTGDAIEARCAMVAVSDRHGTGKQIVHRSGEYRDRFIVEDRTLRLQNRLLQYDCEVGAPIGPLPALRLNA